jgi:hypothetical protein
MSENSLGMEGYLVRMYLLLGFSGVVMIGILEYRAIFYELKT